MSCRILPVSGVLFLVLLQILLRSCSINVERGPFPIPENQEMMDPLWPGVMEYKWETASDSTRWAI